MSSAISPPICAVSSSDSFFSSLSLPKSSENPKTSLTPSTQSSNPLTNSPLFDSSVLPYPTLSKPTAASAHDASAGQSVEVTPNPPPYTLPRPALSAEALVPPPSTIIRVRGKLVVVSGTEHAGPVRPDKTTRRARATPYAQDSAVRQFYSLRLWRQLSGIFTDLRTCPAHWNATRWGPYETPPSTDCGLCASPRKTQGCGHRSQRPSRTAKEERPTSS